MPWSFPGTTSAISTPKPYAPPSPTATAPPRPTATLPPCAESSARRGDSGSCPPRTSDRAIDLPAVRGQRLPRGRALTRGELRALFESCRGGSPADARDAALMGVLYAAGLRRAEVVALDVADYDPETGALVVRGKGNKQRIAYIDNGAADAVREWIAVRGDSAGPLFCPVTQLGEVVIRPMTDQAVYGILQNRAAKAKVRAFSPHDLRRSCVSDLLDAGVDISVVQRFVGHANVTTTPRYDRRGEQAKRKAAKSLHVPFVVDSTSG